MLLITGCKFQKSQQQSPSQLEIKVKLHFQHKSPKQQLNGVKLKAALNQVVKLLSANKTKVQRCDDS